MFQTLKLYSQILLQHIADHFARKQVFTLRATNSQVSHAKHKNLDYTQTNRAVLITELDQYGEEVPVAVAFMKKDAEVVILQLCELYEDE